MSRLPRRPVLAVILALLVVWGPLAAAGAATPAADLGFDIVELGTLGGGASRAYGINDQGWVVGHADDAEGRRRAVLWKEGNVVDLGTLGGDHATALAINGQGQVIGDSTTVPGVDLGDPGGRAFLWQAGWMRSLGTLGGDSSVAQGINERGQVVGASTTAPGQRLDFFADGPRAFLWEDGRMTDLGALGGDRSWALAINDAGQVVGTAATADGEDHAFLWEDGRMTDLGALDSGRSVALDVNRHGQAVGGATAEVGQEFTGQGTQAVGWETGRMAALVDGTGPDGVAYGITDRGEVVGEAIGSGAVLWRGGEAVALIDLLAEEHGWDALGIARGINERGQIVGWGERDEAARAFLISPPSLRSKPLHVALGPATTAAADLDGAEVATRARRAIQEAGAFRYQVFSTRWGRRRADAARRGRDRGRQQDSESRWIQPGGLRRAGALHPTPGWRAASPGSADGRRRTAP